MGTWKLTKWCDVPLRWSEAHRVEVYMGAVREPAAHAVEGVQVPLPAFAVCSHVALPLTGAHVRVSSASERACACAASGSTSQTLSDGSRGDTWRCSITCASDP